MDRESGDGPVLEQPRFLSVTDVKESGNPRVSDGTEAAFLVLSVVCHLVLLATGIVYWATRKPKWLYAALAVCAVTVLVLVVGSFVCG